MEAKIKASELRPGVFLKDKLSGNIGQVLEISQTKVLCKMQFSNLSQEVFLWEPIPLTEDILVKCPQIKSNPKSKIMRNYIFDLGRGRHLSISDIGTQNGFIWLCYKEKNNTIGELICLYNFDYDGQIYLHTFQNLIHSLTGQELNIKL